MKKYYCFKTVLLSAIILTGCTTAEVERTIDPLPAVATQTQSVTKTADPAQIVEQTPTPYRGNQTPEPITLDNKGFIQYGDVYKHNGYYYTTEGHANNMWIAGLPTYETQFMMMPMLVQGSVWAYEPDLMEATTYYHGQTLKDSVDGIATPFCSMIGSYAWLKRPYDEGIVGTGEWEGPYKVGDCAGVGDLYNVVVNRGEVAEIGFQTAHNWTMIKRWEVVGLESSNSIQLYDWYWDFRKVDNVMLSFIPPECLPENAVPTDLIEWYNERAVYYETQEDFDNAYYPLMKVKDGQLFWKFALEGEWTYFGDLNNYNDYCSDFWVNQVKTK